MRMPPSSVQFFTSMTFQAIPPTNRIATSPTIHHFFIGLIISFGRYSAMPAFHHCRHSQMSPTSQSRCELARGREQ